MKNTKEISDLLTSELALVAEYVSLIAEYKGLLNAIEYAGLDLRSLEMLNDLKIELNDDVPEFGKLIPKLKDELQERLDKI